MKRLTIRLIVAVLTFTIGVALPSCRSRKGSTSSQSSETSPSNSKLDPQWIFISKDIRWELPPKVIIKDYGLFYDGYGDLMILYPRGELAIVSCDFRKDGKTGQISIYAAHNCSVDKGRWSRNDDGTLTTVSRFCAGGMGRDRTNEAPVEKRWTIADPSRNRSVLTSKDESMVLLPESFKDLDGITYLLNNASHCK